MNIQGNLKNDSSLSMSFKKLSLIGLLIGVHLVFSQNLKAAPQNPPKDVEKYRWLYEALFNKSDREGQPNESFKSFYVHLLDSDQNFPEPQQIINRNLKQIEKVEGTIIFVNEVKKKYRYDILKSAEGNYILNVKIHLKDPKNDDFNNFQEKLKIAENTWNANRVKTDFNYQFKFDLVENEEDSHFSVNVFDKTRGPYDRNWGRSWTATVIAHEVGHMLGLGDEYQTLSGKIDCIRDSLMCDSWSGKLMPHNYYFVLRRLVTK